MVINKKQRSFDSRNLLSLSFNGVDNYIPVGTGKIFDTAQGTFGARVNISSLIDGRRMFGFGGDGTTGFHSFEIRLVSGSYYFAVTNITGGTSNVVRGTTPLAINTTYNIIILSNSTVWKMYLNGNVEPVALFVGVNNGNWYNDVGTPANSMTIMGAVKFNGSIINHWPGKIDEVYNWTNEISAAQVTELYNGGVTIDPRVHSNASALNGYWRCGDAASIIGTNIFVPDLRVAKNNGLSVNMVHSTSISSAI